MDSSSGSGQGGGGEEGGGGGGSSFLEEVSESSGDAPKIPPPITKLAPDSAQESESDGGGGGQGGLPVLAGDGEGDEEASAPEHDRIEGDAPFYNGVRVQNLFLDEDTGAQQWCVGTIQYVRKSTGEFRIYFDTVPSWESGKKLYWPADDPDMTVMSGQDHEARAKTDEEKMAVTEEMLQAAKDEDWHAVKKTVWRRALVNFADPGGAGWTALHFAAYCGASDVVAYLLDHEADPKRTDTEDNTPLHLAAHAGDEETVRMLLRAGADVFARNFDDVQPIELAQFFEHKAIEKVLARYMQRSLEKKHLSLTHEALQRATAGAETTQTSGEGKSMATSMVQDSAMAE